MDLWTMYYINDPRKTGGKKKNKKTYIKICIIYIKISKNNKNKKNNAFSCLFYKHYKNLHILHHKKIRNIKKQHRNMVK